MRLPALLLAEARKVASDRQMTLTELLETGLRLELRSLEQAPPPIDLPVCTESGKSPAFAPGLPQEATTWSAGAWEMLTDAHADPE